MNPAVFFENEFFFCILLRFLVNANNILFEIFDDVILKSTFL